MGRMGHFFARDVFAEESGAETWAETLVPSKNILENCAKIDLCSRLLA
jgi:hypothetical protein